MTSRPAIAPADGALPGPAAPAAGLSLATLNVLLPNGSDGWWVDKFYSPSEPVEQRTWPRRRALLATHLLAAQTDVICLQEALADSFDDDFSFLTDAGYGALLHRKGFLRCATFWRADRWALVGSWHLDRTLLTALSPLGPDGRPTAQVVYVANAHLTAGPDPRRRVGQIFSALDRVRKEAIRRKVTPASVPMLVAGDFNCELSGTGIAQILAGEITPDFRDPAHPDTALTSKRKAHPLGAFTDTYAAAFPAPPPSMILPRLAPLFLEGGQLTAAAREQLGALFDRFATDGAMDRAAIDAWATQINGGLRGSERRKALERLGEREALSREDLLAVYESELAEGKYWGPWYDLHACGVSWPSPLGAPFEGRFDHICHSPALRLDAVRALLTDEQRARIAAGDTLPNRWWPSDHLLLAARFALV